MLQYSTIAYRNQGLQRYYQLEALSRNSERRILGANRTQKDKNQTEECGMQPRHQHELQCIHKDMREKVAKGITEEGTPFEGQQ